MTNTDLVGLLKDLSNSYRSLKDQNNIVKIIHDFVIDNGKYFEVENEIYNGRYYKFYEVEIDRTETYWGLVTHIRVWPREQLIDVVIANGSFLDDIDGITALHTFWLNK